ncbi:MAG: acyl-CoA dehydrogenase family protein [Pseudomonadota bacterium]
MNATETDFGRIDFSEEQSDLLEVAAAFCREKSRPEKVRELLNAETGFEPDVWQQIVELGWLGIAVPETYAGVGLTLGECVPVVEQMGRRLMATPFLSSTLASQAILAGGSEAQKQTFLPEIVGGRVATLAVLENNADWDLTQISATAEETKEGFKFNGVKQLVCDGGVAGIFVVTARLNGETRLFIVQRSNVPEDALRREIVIDETKRCFALDLSQVAAAAHACMPAELTTAALEHIEQVGALLSAAESCGGAQNVIDYTIDYLNTRKQFGKTIGSYQALKHPLVDAFVQYEQSRSHLYSAAASFGAQGTGAIATHMAKAQCDRAISYAADRSIQFHGGFGFTYDCDAQLYRRRAFWHAAVFGDAVHHKKKLAALVF